MADSVCQNRFEDLLLVVHCVKRAAAEPGIEGTRYDNTTASSCCATVLTIEAALKDGTPREERPQAILTGVEACFQDTVSAIEAEPGLLAINPHPPISILPNSSSTSSLSVSSASSASLKVKCAP